MMGPGRGVSLALAAKLNALETPYSIDSWTRTKAHNRAVGGSDKSLHLYGAAADLLPETPGARDALLAECKAAGFSEIRVYEADLHVHVGIWPGQAQDWQLVKKDKSQVRIR